jgi:hypothetical protein
VRKALAWLGNCKRDQAGHSTHLFFEFAPEADAAAKLKLKIEINTREHTPVHAIKTYPLQVENGWFNGKVELLSYEPEELFGTKLRALLQRRKGRDLFDLNEGLSQLKLDAAKVVACFEHYIGLEGVKITRAHAEQRMLEKLRHSLTEDVAPMLPAGVAYGDKEARAAFTRIWIELVARISGDAWKSTPAAVQELRKTLGADFLKGAI